MLLLQLGEQGRGLGLMLGRWYMGRGWRVHVRGRPEAGAIPGWRDREGTGTGGAGTGGAGTGGGLATGGAAACAVMADSIASIRADMDEMTATNVCKVHPTLLAALIERLIVVLVPAEDVVVVVIVGALQHTEVLVVATVVVAMP